MIDYLVPPWIIDVATIIGVLIGLVQLLYDIVQGEKRKEPIKTPPLI